ncbi:hypothetical protein RPE78_08500 [Thioclava litoralis]|uniref:Uncharacterized protein n=1 Tax=Thioclava litoralis TaxID=3076557 RepID=A0ABZ1DY06_9RHOB|nr:hypothetical protein RPE78_08500 [Thioclava sp. FTW29]
MGFAHAVEVLRHTIRCIVFQPDMPAALPRHLSRGLTRARIRRLSIRRGASTWFCASVGQNAFVRM